MTSIRRHSQRLALLVAACAVTALSFASPASLEARGGAGDPGAPPAGGPPAGGPPAGSAPVANPPVANPPVAGPKPGNPNQVLGARLFDQCVRWVGRGTRGVGRTTDFYIGLTAELDLDTTRHRGPMRLWWKAPDKFRQALTTRGQTTTKILNNEFMWIVHPNQRVERIHGTPAGAGSVRQLKEDRERMADLAQFITLDSLRGPSVVFEFGGEKSGSGSYRGKWVKLTRRARGATLMHFWLAYEKDARGAYTATWPGIVRVEGDARKGIPTEDFILKGWMDSPPGQARQFRYPRDIEAFSISPGKPSVRFLKATVNTIRINAGMPDTLFSPPTGR